jgi:leader peptidase (prepilin peptidase)/N-methyltransferase
VIASGADPLAIAGAVALGLIFGSFANVCIHRLPSGESVITPRSRCPRCGTIIRWYDNLPVLSWLLLAGRCRSCREPISAVYPLVEATMAAGFLGACLRFGATIDGVAAAWLFFTCIVLVVIDKRHFILPDALTLTGTVAGLCFALWRGGRTALAGAWEEGALAWLGGPFQEPVLPLASLVGAAAGAAMPLLARVVYVLARRRSGRTGGGDGGGGPADPVSDSPGAFETEAEIERAALAEGMGLGDVKMMGMVGAFLGARMALVTILVGSIAGCLVVIPWLVLTRRGFRTPVPFGPFLAFGALVAAFAGDALASGYSDLVQMLIF